MLTKTWINHVSQYVTVILYHKTAIIMCVQYSNKTVLWGLWWFPPLANTMWHWQLLQLLARSSVGWKYYIWLIIGSYLTPYRRSKWNHAPCIPARVKHTQKTYSWMNQSCTLCTQLLVLIGLDLTTSISEDDMENWWTITLTGRNFACALSVRLPAVG